MKASSQFEKSYQGEANKHIVIIGNVTPNNLMKFLKEFYHPYHKANNEMKVLIIQNQEPAKVIIIIDW